jgi:hypothetical protein
MSTVRITRPRHPLWGQQLPVLGRMRRHGLAELLLVLPDGSKSLIPAAWTDLHETTGGEAAEPGTVGSLADLLACHELVAGLAARVAEAVDGQQAARQSSCKEDNRAACATQSDTRGGADATAGADRRVSRGAASRGGGDAGRPDRQGRRAGTAEGGR